MVSNYVLDMSAEDFQATLIFHDINLRQLDLFLDKFTLWYKPDVFEFIIRIEPELERTGNMYAYIDKMTPTCKYIDVKTFIHHFNQSLLNIHSYGKRN